MNENYYKRSGLRRLASVALVIIILGVGTGGFTYLPNRKDDNPYTLATLGRGNIDRLVSATGRLEPVVSVKVGTQVSGTIKELYADYNATVKKGQVMAQLDPDTFQAQLNRAKAELETAQRNLEKGRTELDNTKINLENSIARLAQEKASVAKAEAGLLSEQANLERARVLAQDSKIKLDRVSRLVAEGIMAASEKDTAQANYDSSLAQVKAVQGQVRAAQAQVEANQAQVEAAQTQIASSRAQVRSAEVNLQFLSSKVEEAKASLTLAQVNLERTTIRAPISGVVVSRDVDVGQTVAASLQSPILFTLAGDLSKMQVIVSTDEADVGNIQLGQPATFTVDAFPGEELKGEVSEVRLAPVVTQNVVTYETVITADNPQLKMRPGMTANASILVERKENVLRVANAALRFAPPDAEKILKAMAEQLRQAGDGGPGIGPRQPGRPGQRGMGMGGRPSGMPGRPGGVGQGGQGKRQRIWLLADNGKPKPAWVVLGSSDGSFTEVLAGSAKEGDQVIVASKGKDSSGPGPSPFPRGFGPPMGRF